MDIYLPDRHKQNFNIVDNLYPLILYIHGGAFKFGDKRSKHAKLIIEEANNRYEKKVKGNSKKSNFYMPAIRVTNSSTV